MRSLRLVSYNVHGCVGLDGQRDVGRVADVLRRLRPDVIGLQEVDGRRGAQLMALARELDMAAVSGPTVHTLHGEFGNALLARLHIVAVRRVDLTFAGREPRGLLDVTLEQEGQPLRVLVAHFGLRRNERGAQSEMVIGQLGRAEAPVTALLGDFNEWWPFGTPLRRLDQRLGRPPRPPTWPSFLPILALDGIWVDPRDALRRLGVARDRLARVASDHLPVVAEVDAYPAAAEPLVGVALRGP